jgi:hypothetical protein
MRTGQLMDDWVEQPGCHRVQKTKAFADIHVNENKN